MSTQLLIYETAVPVSGKRHGDCSVEIGTSYAFSRNVNSVPLMAVEFPMAASEYAIVFAGTEQSIMPAVILGMRNNENLYLAKDNEWKASYIPAFVRRYPFVFSSSDDGSTFTLCIDEAFSGFNRVGRGQRLFTDDGKATPYVDNVLKFNQEYRNQFLRTQAYCKKIQELELLEPMQAQFSFETGQKMSLSGFLSVNRQKLKALPGDALAELSRTDGLELLYLQMQSMRNFTLLKDRMLHINAKIKGQPAAQPAEAQ